MGKKIINPDLILKNCNYDLSKDPDGAKEIIKYCHKDKEYRDHSFEKYFTPYSSNITSDVFTFLITKNGRHFVYKKDLTQDQLYEAVCHNIWAAKEFWKYPELVDVEFMKKCVATTTDSFLQHSKKILYKFDKKDIVDIYIESYKLIENNVEQTYSNCRWDASQKYKIKLNIPYFIEKIKNIKINDYLKIILINDVFYSLPLKNINDRSELSKLMIDIFCNYVDNIEYPNLFYNNHINLYLYYANIDENERSNYDNKIKEIKVKYLTNIYKYEKDNYTNDFTSFLLDECNIISRYIFNDYYGHLEFFKHYPNKNFNENVSELFNMLYENKNIINTNEICAAIISIIELRKIKFKKFDIDINCINDIKNTNEYKKIQLLIYI